MSDAAPVRVDEPPVEPGGDARRSFLVGVAMIAAANALAGASYPAQKLALEAFGVGTISTLRNLFAVPLFLFWMRRFPVGHRAFTRGEWGRLVLVGVLGYGTPMLLGNLGVELSTAANGSILILLEPITIVLLAWMFLGERVGRLELVGFVLGLAGAMAVVLEDASLDGLLVGEHLEGNLLLALHAVLWGLYTPLAKPLLDRGHDPVRLALVALVFSLAVTVPAAAVELAEFTWTPAVPAALGWIAFLALTASFVATLLWVLALRRLPASLVAPFIFLQPLSGVLLGVLLVGESLSSGSVLGGVLISAGVLLVVGTKKRS